MYVIIIFHWQSKLKSLEDNKRLNEWRSKEKNAIYHSPVRKDTLIKFQKSSGVNSLFSSPLVKICRFLSENLQLSRHTYWLTNLRKVILADSYAKSFLKKTRNLIITIQGEHRGRLISEFVYLLTHSLR